MEYSVLINERLHLRDAPSRAAVLARYGIKCAAHADTGADA